jgi:hypothetical protein
MSNTAELIERRIFRSYGASNILCRAVYKRCVPNGTHCGLKIFAAASPFLRRLHGRKSQLTAP